VTLHIWKLSKYTLASLKALLLWCIYKSQREKDNACLLIVISLLLPDAVLCTVDQDVVHEAFARWRECRDLVASLNVDVQSAEITLFH